MPLQGTAQSVVFAIRQHEGRSTPSTATQPLLTGARPGGGGWRRRSSCVSGAVGDQRLVAGATRPPACPFARPPAAVRLLRLCRGALSLTSLLLEAAVASGGGGWKGRGRGTSAATASKRFRI
jgi:hypothetical protein